MWTIDPRAHTSPGWATYERERMEDAAAREAIRCLRRFLLDVERDALEATTSPVLLAAGIPEPFSLARVLRFWDERVARPMGKWFADTFGPRLTDTYLSAVIERVSQSPLPSTIYREARQVLVDAHTEGWTRTKLQQGLTTALEPVSRELRATATRIVRTEVTAAFNHQVLEELARRGFAGKRWVTMRDARVRPTHAEASGQTVPLEVPFTVGGYQLEVPGDPAAPPAETANCRCVLYGQKESGALVPGGWLNLNATMEGEG